MSCCAAFLLAHLWQIRWLRNSHVVWWTILWNSIADKTESANFKALSSDFTELYLFVNTDGKGFVVQNVEIYNAVVCRVFQSNAV